MSNANYNLNQRWWQQVQQEQAAKVRELKAKPWWSCTDCAATFRWDEHHFCGRK